MPLMTWTEKMGVGVKVLDEDHKKLVGLINDLHDALKAGHGKDILGKILDSLVTYTKYHFDREEQLFAKTGYPNSHAHKKEHDNLTQQVLGVQSKYKAGADTFLTMEVMDFLKTWLTNHIQGSDQKYTAHLNTHGVH